MSWAKLDDNFHAHPRTLQAGLEANGLFCRAISYCADYLTDGFVPDQWVGAQGPPAQIKRASAKLIEVGLWDRIEGGYMIIGYLKRNPSRTKVREARKRDLERKAGGDSNGNPSGIRAESGRNV